MSHSDTIPLHSSAQSDIDEIENLIHASVQSGPAIVLPARPPSPTRASIPVSSSPFTSSNLPPLPVSYQKPTPVPSAPPPPPRPGPAESSSGRNNGAATGFGSPPNTLTEPVWDTVKRDLSRIVSNLKLVVFPNPFREDPGKALRDWDLWGPFFFIVFLGLTLSWSASVKKVTPRNPPPFFPLIYIMCVPLYLYMYYGSTLVLTICKSDVNYFVWFGSARLISLKLYKS